MAYYSKMGTIHNHYFGREEKEDPKILDDEKNLLAAEALGKFLYEIRHKPEMPLVSKEKLLKKLDENEK